MVNRFIFMANLNHITNDKVCNRVGPEALNLSQVKKHTQRFHEIA